MSEKLPQNIGIIGGGQLGRMLTQAALPLGFKVSVLQENSLDCPAVQVGAVPFEGSIMDGDAIRKFVRANDVTTWEIEHINADVLTEMHSFGNYAIEPNPERLSVIQDKLAQKSELKDLSFPVGEFWKDIDSSWTARQWRGAVIKSRFGGYDGRGNYKLKDDEFLDTPGTNRSVKDFFGDTKIYIEQAVDFEKELSVIVARDKQGGILTYPVVETIHKNNICHTVISPARINTRLAKAADELARSVASDFLDGAGVFAIEMFADGDDLLVNEIAPRVHNSGHHTIEANATSQFEQHIRAITGLPLGPTEQASSAAVMVNILGTREAPLDVSGSEQARSLPDTYVHFYGKASRPERKIGHITVLASDVDTALRRAEQAHGFLTEV